MKLVDFDYPLPESLIAQHPLKKREAARLLIIDRAKQTIAHDIFSNLEGYLPVKSCLVLNDSKVVHARLLGRRASGAQVEIFLLKKLADGHSFEALLRPLRRLKTGETITLNEGLLKATIVDKDNRIVRFEKKNITAALKRYGHIPLPPYIKREDTKDDKIFYQTVYAKKEGSVAAPTAGLHFTNSLLAALKKHGHTLERVTLHINYGTFKPVETDDIRQHVMHKEEYAVSAKTWKNLLRVKANADTRPDKNRDSVGVPTERSECRESQGQRIVAVGTTSCRVLETIAETGQLKGETDKFIYPGYNFKMTDALLTNFHLPKSTLLMLVCAFGGRQLVMKAYQEAIEKRYRFYSYGDAMLVV